ncbi:hypothetical protein H4219_003830 [Mycoemilia scoparia]|uniref:Uncharacterized protein n=1 Tax=Mycoemilia scoparia TaxID=417184 RepID=A0A9W8DST1_9FUNG|nr:hypothetical protein H4219_003830 [Mycoemilia scoparia]
MIASEDIIPMPPTDGETAATSLKSVDKPEDIDAGGRGAHASDVDEDIDYFYSQHEGLTCLASEPGSIGAFKWINTTEDILRKQKLPEDKWVDTAYDYLKPCVMELYQDFIKTAESDPTKDGGGSDSGYECCDDKKKSWKLFRKFIVSSPKDSNRIKEEMAAKRLLELRMDTTADTTSINDFNMEFMKHVYNCKIDPEHRLVHAIYRKKMPPVVRRKMSEMMGSDKDLSALMAVANNYKDLIAKAVQEKVHGHHKLQQLPSIPLQPTLPLPSVSPFPSRHHYGSGSSCSNYTRIRATDPHRRLAPSPYSHHSHHQPPSSQQQQYYQPQRNSRISKDNNIRRGGRRSCSRYSREDRFIDTCIPPHPTSPPLPSYGKRHHDFDDTYQDISFNNIRIANSSSNRRENRTTHRHGGGQAKKFPPYWLVKQRMDKVEYCRQLLNDRCLLCNSTQHILRYCPQFKEMDANRYFESLREDKDPENDVYISNLDCGSSTANGDDW